jgi:3',5'-cyclic AMP phosphodiesterase CpdA
VEIKVEETPFDLERLQREVNILLISDLHYDIKKEQSKGDWVKGETVNKCLIDSLVEQPEPGWEPDIVVVAGDLVNLNKVENYKLYFSFVDSLTKAFPNLKDAFFSTPGNHDVNRENAVSAFPYLYKFQKLYPTVEVTSSFTNNPVVDTIYTTVRQRIEEIPELDKVLVAFEEEYFKTYLQKRKQLDDDGILNPIKVDEIFSGIKTVYSRSLLGVTMVSLNSSFFCNLSQTGQDRNHLFLIRSIVDKVANHLKENGNGSIITFMHHPYYYLHESEHVAPVLLEDKDEPLNNFNKLVKRSDLILSGHMHGDLREPTFLQQNAYLVTNGTSYTTDNFEGKCYPYTYALLKINKQLGKFSMKKFRYEAICEDSLDKYAYKCISEKTLPYYKFFQRAGGPNNSVETEKVRVLHYFKNIGDKRDPHSGWRFFIYQLRMYCPGLKNDSISVLFEEEQAPHKPEIKQLRISYGEEVRIIIYIMDGLTVVPDIREILDGGRGSFQKGYLVFFSVKMELLFSGELPSVKIVENLRQTFQADVLIRKIEMVNINLLYH